MAVHDYFCFRKMPSARRKVSFVNLSRLHRRGLLFAACALEPLWLLQLAVRFTSRLAATLREGSHHHGPSFGLTTFSCRGCAEACNKFHGLSRFFCVICSKITRPTCLACTIPNTGGCKALCISLSRDWGRAGIRKPNEPFTEGFKPTPMVSE